MIPILFPGDSTNFTTNGIGRLSETTKARVTEERNGIYVLSLNYPVSGKLFEEIQNESIIVAKPSYGKRNQAFTVSNIVKNMNGTCTITAEHIGYRANYIPVLPFSATGITETLQYLNGQIGSRLVEPSPFTIDTDIVNTGSPYSFALPRSLRSCLGGDEDSLLDIFASRGTGEFEWDNFDIHFHMHRGSNKGYSVRYAKNLVSLENESDTEELITGVLPYWTSSDTESGDADIIWGSVQYATNYQDYPVKKTVAVDFTEYFESMPSLIELNAAGAEYANSYNLPDEGIDLEFYDIDDQNVSLCDTIHVYFEKLGVDVDMKVVKTVWDVLEDRYETITVGAIRSNFSGTLYDSMQDIVINTSNKFNNVYRKIDYENGQITTKITDIEETLEGVLVDVVTYYIQKEEGVTPSLDDPDWSTTFPAAREGYNTWSKTVYYYGDSSTSTTGPSAITDAGIASVVMEYARSTSNVTAPLAGWSETVPEISQGFYLWSRYIYTMINGSQTISTPTLALDRMYRLVSENTYDLKEEGGVVTTTFNSTMKAVDRETKAREDSEQLLTETIAGVRGTADDTKSRLDSFLAEGGDFYRVSSMTTNTAEKLETVNTLAAGVDEYVKEQQNYLTYDKIAATVTLGYTDSDVKTQVRVGEYAIMVGDSDVWVATATGTKSSKTTQTGRYIWEDEDDAGFSLIYEEDS